MPPMSIATFPDDFGAASACAQPSAPPAISAIDSHRQQQQQQQMMLGAGMVTGSGAISELAGLQNELEGIQAGIHQVCSSFGLSSL